MNTQIESILNIIDISYTVLQENAIIVPREIFLNLDKYYIVKEKIPLLKQHFSSSFLTSLQKNATIKQKWPLLNLVRQILKKNDFEMNPLRKSDGYDDEGKKLFKRYFIINKLEVLDSEIDEPS
tara:strand:+ start:232 stop:603 length:372 start_codon:yes stop_codon:yes gene_type:complete